jgi:SNF family Na+-dependent transporter
MPRKGIRDLLSVILFTGLGYCTLVVITLVTIYYQVIVAWTIFYVFASFTSELGWGSCGHDFNTDGELQTVLVLDFSGSMQRMLKPAMGPDPEPNQSTSFH